jgi:hypothetical protein
VADVWCVGRKGGGRELPGGGEWACGRLTPTDFGPGRETRGQIFGRIGHYRVEKLDLSFSVGQG